MFKCQSCLALKDEVKFLREQVRALNDRLVALTNVSAYQAVTMPTDEDPNDYFGNGNDEFISFDDMGQKMLLRKEPKLVD